MSFYLTHWCRLLVLCVVVLCLPGCWDYQKINERAQIIGIGVDPIEGNPNLLSFTLQVPVLGGSESQSGGPGRGSSGLAGDYRNFTIRAKGLNEAVSEAQSQYDKMFYLGNLQAVVMNRSLTSNQVQHVITEMLRTPYLDKLAWLVFTRQSAVEILQAKGSSTPADEIDRFFGISVKQHGLTTRTRLWQFWRDDRAIGIESRTGMVRTNDDRVQVYGVMAFDGTRPALEIYPPDTIYLNIVTDHVQRVALWFQDHARAFEVQNIYGESRIWVSMDHQKPILHVKVSLSGMLAQSEGGGADHLTEADMNRYQSVMRQQVVSECGRVIHQLQKRHIDVFGFGQYVYVHHLEPEPSVSDHWSEDYGHAPLDIQANVKLVQKGILM